MKGIKIPSGMFAGMGTEEDAKDEGDNAEELKEEDENGEGEQKLSSDNLNNNGSNLDLSDLLARLAKLEE